MKIAVIGSGYVGLVAAACFAELGHEVLCVDNDPCKLAALQRGETPIHEDFLPELLARHRGNRLQYTSCLPQAVRSSSVIFIAVGTPPSETGDADLSYVEGVAREIAQSLNGYKVIVEKSTVPVYTSEWISRVMRLTGAHELDFDVVSNPEFLREGTAVTDFLYPDRIIIGSDNARAASVLNEIYAPLTEGNYYQQNDCIPQPSGTSIPPRLIQTSAKSAELIKHASNAFLAMKISFINAVANVCEAVDADVEQVALGMGTDDRIGSSFLRAGIGYGGSCFPKDVSAFRAVAEQCGVNFELLDNIIKTNNEQKQLFLRRIRKTLWTLRGKCLGVLGLAFKGGTDDVRESPAIEIIKSLMAEGCSITAYDPAAMPKAKEILNGQIKYAADPYQVAAGADALLILTDWSDFAALDLVHLRGLLRYPIVIDGRNLYKAEAMEAAGLMYVSIGRPVVTPPAIHAQNEIVAEAAASRL